MKAFSALLPFVAIAASASSVQAHENLEWVASHLGNLSPYRKAPVPAGVSETLPSDCQVDAVMQMGRHGSRFPLASELVFIQNLSSKLANASAAIQNAKLPQELQFLKEGYKTALGHDNLTAIGRLELFKHGVDFLLKYRHLPVQSVLAGGQDRVIESAQWWSQAYFGRHWPEVSSSVFSTIPEDNKTVSWITPMITCARWRYAYGNNATIQWGSVYLPPITARLNKELPGVNLTNADVHGALYACAYDLAYYGTSPWCGAFKHEEIRNFEYELDLLMTGAFGYNLPNNMGPVLGSLFVNKLIERFTNSSGNAQPVYVEFGHDTTIDMALSALGLVKDVPPLSPNGPPPPHRKWRTTYQVPFGAQMTWERFSCKRSFHGPQIRLILNDSPLPLSTCASSNADKRYGTCSLDAFVKANSFSTGIKWGDATWNATCGPAVLG